MLNEKAKLKEECGVFAIWNHPEAARLTYYGLHSLQHRGQEGCGIVVSNGKQLLSHKGVGLVNEVFGKEELAQLTGDAAIGHVRYSTQGASDYANVQPLLFHSQTGSLALAHNGNLVNARMLKYRLEGRGSIFQTSSDTEVIAHLVKRAGFLTMEDRLKHALSMIEGAFSLVVATEDRIFAARDPNGLRPLMLGRLGKARVIASETCAFDVIGATYEKDIDPGTLLVIDNHEIRTIPYANEARRNLCSMEYIYFSRPDSNLEQTNVHQARKKLGMELAKEAPVEADVVTGVPDSSISAAIGYAEASGLPYELGLIKNRYVGRTFIQPSQKLREQGVRMKLSAVRGVVNGKRVVMVDDSIVRGTTSRRIVRMLYEAGAKEVHVRISAPPIKHPCFYGVDISSHAELIASRLSVPEIEREINATSLAYLSIEGMIRAIGRGRNRSDCGQCLACFTGNYPTNIYSDTVLPHEKEGISIGK